MSQRRLAPPREETQTDTAPALDPYAPVGAAAVGAAAAPLLPRLARSTAWSSSAWLHRPSDTGLRARMFWVFQWLRSRTAAIVGLVVPSSLEIWASVSSGWFLTSPELPS